MMALTISTLTAFSIMLTACGDATKTKSPQEASPHVESCMVNLPKVRGKEIKLEDLLKENGKFTAQEIHYAYYENSNNGSKTIGGSYIVDSQRNTYKTSHCLNTSGDDQKDEDEHYLVAYEDVNYTFRSNNGKTLQSAVFTLTSKFTSIKIDNNSDNQGNLEQNNDDNVKWFKTGRNEFTSVREIGNSDEEGSFSETFIIKYRLVDENEEIKIPMPEKINGNNTTPPTNNDISTNIGTDTNSTSTTTGAGSSTTTISEKATLSIDSAFNRCGMNGNYITVDRENAFLFLDPVEKLDQYRKLVKAGACSNMNRIGAKNSQITIDQNNAFMFLDQNILVDRFIELTQFDSNTYPRCGGTLNWITLDGNNAYMEIDNQKRFEILISMIKDNLCI